MKTTGINIEEIKDKAVHAGLLEALYLINAAYNILWNAMDEKEFEETHQHECMGETVDKLSTCATYVSYLIGESTGDRIQDLTK